MSRGDAVRKCADVMIEKLKEDDMFYEAFSHDEIHEDIAGKMPPEPDEDLSDARSEIVDELGGACEYIVCDNFGREYKFSVDESELNGKVSALTRWNDADDHSGETPITEFFETQDEAKRSFLRYAGDEFRKEGQEVPECIERDVENDIGEFGAAYVTVSDRLSVNCSIWDLDFKNMKWRK